MGYPSNLPPLPLVTSAMRRAHASTYLRSAARPLPTPYVFVGVLTEIKIRSALLILLISFLYYSQYFKTFLELIFWRFGKISFIKNTAVTNKFRNFRQCSRDFLAHGNNRLGRKLVWLHKLALSLLLGHAQIKDRVFDHECVPLLHISCLLSVRYVTKPTYSPFYKFHALKIPWSSTEIPKFICESCILWKWDFHETSGNKQQKFSN